MAVLRTEDVLLGALALGWLAKTALHKDLGLVVRTPLNRPILAYVVCALTATLVGYLSGTVETATGFLYVLKYTEYFVVYYIVSNHLTDARQAWRLVTVAFLTAALVGLFGAAQIPDGQRVSAPFEGDIGEPNTFGGYTLLILALASGLALEAAKPGVRIASVALIALVAPAFVFTLSRASYLGVLPAVAVLAGLSRRRRLVIGTCLLGVIVLPLASVGVPDAVVERVRSTFRAQHDQAVVTLGEVSFDASTSERLLNMRRAWEGWLERPLLGYGVTGFGFVDGQYTRTLVETGLVGMAALLWLLGAVVRSAMATLRVVHDPEARGLALGFLAGTAGLIAHAVGTNTFIIVRIVEPYWFFAAVVIALPRLCRRDVAREAAGAARLANRERLR